MPARGERGYALLAAVTATAALAYVAFQVLAADAGEIVSVQAEAARARLAAGADAGMMLALQDLSNADAASRWPIDGKTQHLSFGDLDLAVSVQDERGKAPLAGLSDIQTRALFQGAGVSGARLDSLVREFHEWQSDMQDVAPASDAAVAAGSRPRGGPFRNVGEPMALKDMDVSLWRVIAPSVTTFFGESGPFEPSNATSLAIATMNATEDDSGGDLSARTAFADEKPSEQIVETDRNLIGRTLTIDVVASDGRGHRGRRTAIFELTGDKTAPYWVRYAE